MDDRVRATKLLARRGKQVTVLGLLRETARWKVPIAATFWAMALLCFFLHLDQVAVFVLGFWLGAQLRDVRVCHAAQSAWPFSERVIDWNEVQRIADGDAP